MQHARLLPALAVIGACLATVAGAATAYASGATPRARSKPAGYTIVSKQFAATAGAESDGSVVCPKATVPIGGSVFVQSSPELRVNVSASFPFGGFWAGSVKNSSDTASTFAVVAVCAKRPTGYRVVQSAMVDQISTLSQGLSCAGLRPAAAQATVGHRCGRERPGRGPRRLCLQ